MLPKALADEKLLFKITLYVPKIDKFTQDRCFSEPRLYKQNVAVICNKQETIRQCCLYLDSLLDHLGRLTHNFLFFHN
jgi:hypothetical protein